MIEFYAAKFSRVPIHDAVLVSCKTAQLLKIKAQMASICTRNTRKHSTCSNKWLDTLNGSIFGVKLSIPSLRGPGGGLVVAATGGSLPTTRPSLVQRIGSPPVHGDPTVNFLMYYNGLSSSGTGEYQCTAGEMV